MYKRVSTKLNFVERENEVLSFWKENNIFEAAQSKNDTKKPFVIYDGPPTANGKPHIGHVLTRAIKDLIPRYKRMKGFDVKFKAGWDTHGLPVELEVEKLLGINGKESIEAYGIEAFVEKCKESVWKYKDEWQKISQRVAFWADLDNAYITYDNTYIESVWWSLKKIWEKDLLYQGYKVVPYCPRCGTSLSSHEVAQGYKDVKDTSVFVRFPVVGEEDTYFAAWTTTPWTLPSNVALVVNPESEYALIEVDGDLAGKYYIAKDLAESVFGEDYRVLSTCKGKELEYKEYKPLFSYALKTIEKLKKKAYYVGLADYVTLTDGTGIVHTAPAFGEDDAQVARKYDLPFVQLVKPDGTMDDDVVDFKGEFCKDADLGIIKKLAQEGHLIKKMKFNHNYPFCWRCDTALIYYARHSWFIKMTAVRDSLMRNNQTVNWLPENVKDGRFGNFLANVVDWTLSRERYWGTPLPVWICGSCEQMHVIGSIEELKSMSPDCPEDIELHKPYIDNVHVNCPGCPGKMTRVPEVIDCWYDSGAMPFAQHHYPFENKDLFEEQFPANFISEAIDQTRGWFYSLMAISTVLFDKSSYENVIVMGHVQDKDGQKMSKHKGNVVDPWHILDNMGADAIRWYFYTNSQPWLPSRYSDDSVAEGQRRFIGTLWNTYVFYITYAEIDGFNPTEHSLALDQLSVMDAWILSKLQTLINFVDVKLEEYDITAAGRAIQDFVDDLSNWYVRRGRARYWKEGMEEDKVQAYMTLFTVLETVVKLSAPFIPFVSESIYQNLVKSVDEAAPRSVHLCDFPVANDALIDKSLEENMASVLEIVSLGRAARNTANMKNRQALSNIYVVSPFNLPETYQSLVLDELNIKNYNYLNDSSGLNAYKVKPQLRTLGKKLGKDLVRVKDILATVDGTQVVEELNEKGNYTLVLDGNPIVLDKEDLIIEVAQMQGLSTTSSGSYTVAIDLTLTDELIEEGLVREFISKIQTMRKENEYEILDRIVITCDSSPELNQVIQKNMSLIEDETLADAITFTPEVEGKIWDINNHACTIRLERREG